MLEKTHRDFLEKEPPWLKMGIKEPRIKADVLCVLASGYLQSRTFPYIFRNFYFHMPVNITTFKSRINKSSLKYKIGLLQM